MKTMKILKILSIVYVFAFLSLYIFCTIFCDDSGYGKEGLALNTEIGRIVISEETCKLTKGVWLQEKRMCKY